MSMLDSDSLFSVCVYVCKCKNKQSRDLYWVLLKQHPDRSVKTAPTLMAELEHIHDSLICKPDA